MSMRTSCTFAGDNAFETNSQVPLRMEQYLSFLLLAHLQSYGHVPACAYTGPTGSTLGSFDQDGYFSSVTWLSSTGFNLQLFHQQSQVLLIRITSL